MAFIERKKCDVCGSEKFKKILSIPYARTDVEQIIIDRYRGNLTKEELTGVPYEILRCQICEFVFQKYVADENLTQRLYSYEEKGRIEKSIQKKKHASIDYYIRNALHVQKIAILASKKPHEISILDFGAGWGYFLHMAQAHGYSITGLDISKERIEHLQKLGIPTVTNLLQLKERKFSFIYSDQTFEHITNPLEKLKELVTLLTSNGLLYIGVPDGKRVEQEISREQSGIASVVFPLEHINCFNNSSLRRLAHEAGLELLSGFSMCKKLLPYLHLTHDAHFLQEAFKAFYTQTHSTGLWFQKIKQ